MTGDPAQQTPESVDRLQLVALVGLMLIGTAVCVQRDDGQSGGGGAAVV